MKIDNQPDSKSSRNMQADFDYKYNDDTESTIRENADTLNRQGLKDKLKKNTDVYLVDSYGEANEFYNLTNVVFVGGP